MNILLNKISSDNTFTEIRTPVVFDVVNADKNVDVVNDNGVVTINYSIFDKFRIKETNIYYKDGRLGIGRQPAFNYKVDIAVKSDAISTGLHIGTGKYGFSLGNGGTTGFIPEIIGIGAGADDAGLYFLGLAGNDIESTTPLLVFDGRSADNGVLTNRPIFGVTSRSYTEFKMLLDHKGRLGLGKVPEVDKLEVAGNISCDDLKLNTESLIDIIAELRAEIQKLKNK